MHTLSGFTTTLFYCDFSFLVLSSATTCLLVQYISTSSPLMGIYCHTFLFLASIRPSPSFLSDYVSFPFPVCFSSTTSRGSLFPRSSPLHLTSRAPLPFSSSYFPLIFPPFQKMKRPPPSSVMIWEPFHFSADGNRTLERKLFYFINAYLNLKY